MSGVCVMRRAGSVRAPKPHALAWSLGVALTQVAVASAAAPLPKYELHDIYVGIVACVGAVLVLCLCQAARTCQRERFTQAEVVVNYWLGCSVFGACLRRQALLPPAYAPCRKESFA